jgi:hypothetical protein
MKLLFIPLILVATSTLKAQNVYKITADSVKLTNTNDSTELIIENHTQSVPGFLFNTGRGRTAFKRPLTKINDSLYLVGADSLQMRLPKAWVQGGNSFGTNGILGTWDNNNLDFYTNHTQRARLDNAGNLLLGYTTANGYKLDVFGQTRSWNYSTVTAGDSFDIKLMANYSFAPSVGASAINFGDVYATVGVNKAQLGNIPYGSLIMGGVSPNRMVALTDYIFNPVFVVDGNGTATINGGYTGIGPGGTPGNGINANAPVFAVNGGRGTGTGAVGDIVFSTGAAQASGSTIHTMTNRWWLKGGTGYLANTSTPTSAMDITGANGYSQFRLRTSYTPSSSADTNGNTGDFSWDSNYIYLKTSAGWKRTTLTTF